MVKIGNLEIGNFPLLLAPMEDVSDPPFRVLCKEYGADVVFTEFISSEGLIRYADKSIEKLDIYEEERPVGIQIFGHDVESMRTTARIVEQADKKYWTSTWLPSEKAPVKAQERESSKILTRWNA